MVVVGHDIGGMVAVAWAARYPDDVAALVTLDVLLPGLGLEEAMDVARGGMWHFGLFMQRGVPEMFLDGHEQEFFSSSFTAISNPGTFGEDDLAYYVTAYRGRRGTSRAMLADRPLTMPVLTVGGGARTGDAAGVALRPHATRLTSLVAPTGHFVAEEDPAWFLRALEDFLR